MLGREKSDEKKNIDKISYNETQVFFDTRAKKYNKDNPYAVTMYQDSNPKLVRERNLAEMNKLKPLLQLDKDSKILDVACGIGRWSDAITEEIDIYCGIDFCTDFIGLAKERNRKKNRYFFNSSSIDVKECICEHNKGTFYRVLLVGALMYLNDNDVESTLEQVESLCDAHSIICVREPIGIEERLTLKEEFSVELSDDYNAIYRTKNELESIFKKTLLNKGFEIDECDFMFQSKELNNRSETTQYYWIIKR